MYKDEFYHETHNFPWWTNGEEYIYGNSQAPFHYLTDGIHDKDEQNLIETFLNERE